MKRFSAKHPVLFGLLATLLLWICYVAAGVAAAAFSGDAVSHQIAEAFGRIAAALLFLWLLRRTELWAEAGIGNPGARSIWILTLLAAVYQFIVSSYALFGDAGFVLIGSAEVAAVALNGSAAGILEELAYRGLVLFALVSRWGRSPGALAGSAIVSSFLFGASHVLRLAVGHPASMVGMLILDTFLAGIYYAAFVLRARSVWPAVAIHVLLNAFVGARAAGVPGFEETISAWRTILLSQIPLVILGLWMLLGGRQDPGSESRAHI